MKKRICAGHSLRSLEVKLKSTGTLLSSSNWLLSLLTFQAKLDSYDSKIKTYNWVKCEIYFLRRASLAFEMT